MCMCTEQSPVVSLPAHIASDEGIESDDDPCGGPQPHQISVLPESQNTQQSVMNSNHQESVHSMHLSTSDMPSRTTAKADETSDGSRLTTGIPVAMTRSALAYFLCKHSSTDVRRQVYECGLLPVMQRAIELLSRLARYR